MEKYGFIYLWYDVKHKKYYLGRHWGTETDGYISSSTNMRNNYKNRPSDFKRKIIKRIYTSVSDLVLEEQLWLNMISPSECCVKYYNKTLKSTTPSTKGYNHTNETKLKISLGNKGKKQSEETKQKLREANQKQFEDPEQVLLRKQKSKELWSDPEYLEKQRKARSKEGFYKGFTCSHSEGTKRRISEQKMGVKQSEESKNKIAQTVANLIWITDGKANKRINRLEQIPEGYRRGRTKKL